MSVITTTCPHCAAEQISLRILSYYAINDIECGLAAACPRCEMPSSFVLRWHGSTSVRHWISTKNVSDNFEILSATRMTVVKIFPHITAHEAPADCTPDVSRIYIQAKNAFKRKDLDAAGMLYRKAAELACKSVDPDGKGMFASRVQSLVSKDIIPKSVSDWATEIRIIGNDAAHEESSPTEEDIQQAAEFVEAFLEYIFTMPARVEKRKSSKSEKNKIEPSN
jgi:hypothetical protein